MSKMDKTDQNKATETEDLMEELGKASVYLQRYVQDQVELAKLQLTERMATAVSTVVLVSILGSMGLIVFALLSIFIVLQLQNWLGSLELALLSLIGVYLVLGLTIFLLRKPLIFRPLIIRFVQKLYE